MTGLTAEKASNKCRVVLVIGGTSGIGLTAARLLLARGDRVAVCGRDRERVDEVVATLGVAAAAGSAVGVTADIAEAGAAERAVAETVAAFGRLDAVVLTAQVMAYGTVEEVDEDAFRRVVDTALAGAFATARAALPRFREAGGGSLVVVSSLLAEIAVPSLSTYCAAKWGQLGLVRSLQLETRGERGIDVSLVLPGAVDTPIYAQAGNWAGRAGHAPPPVVAPERVAAACVRALDRPRRLVHVGPANRISVAGYRLLPAVYDRLAPLLVRRVVLRGRRRPLQPGNVLAPRPSLEAERGGWSWWGRRGGG